jgi:hypothetical protein
VTETCPKPTAGRPNRGERCRRRTRRPIAAAEVTGRWHAAAGERAGVFGPVPRSAVTAAAATNPQKVGGTARPRAALAHDLPHEGGDRVGVDDALDRSPAVCLIGAAEGARQAKESFRRPLPALRGLIKALLRNELAATR